MAQDPFPNRDIWADRYRLLVKATATRDETVTVNRIELLHLLSEHDRQTDRANDNYALYSRLLHPEN